MFRRIIGFSIEQKPIIIFLVIVLIGFGIYSMYQLPIDAVPDITNNQVQIVTSSPSLSPQEVERLITYPIEVAMANITDVIEIRSISRYGLSVITVVFNDRIQVLDARQHVNEILQQAKEDIPDEYGSPKMLPITTGLGEIFQYTLEVEEEFKSYYNPMRLREIQDWIVKRQLSGIPGIVDISSFGGYLKQYEIAIDPYLMRKYKLTCADIYEAINKNNQSSGGSYIEKSTDALYIRTEGLLSTIEEIEAISICQNDGMPILVEHVAEVKFGYAPRFGAMTKNGLGEAVGGITLMLKGANSSKVIREVKKKIKLIEKSLPPGIVIKPYLDRAELVKRTTSTVAKNLLEGSLIVIFILVLLLGNYRSGIIVASVIPLSLLFGFIMMHLLGVSANLMSLGAIDFGIVVDGAVIIVESILYQLQQKNSGKLLNQKQMDSEVYAASSSIYQSASFGVIIILVVFIPILTLTGIEGKNFRPMAQTFSFVIMGAFLLSMTYVPMMSSLFLKKQIINKRTFSDRIIRLLKFTYHPVLKYSLRHKFLILIITALVFLVSLISFPFLGGEFIPTLEEGDLAMQMTIPPGSSLSQSIKMSTAAEQILLENFPEINQVVSKIGTAEIPTDPMAVEDADIMIILKPKKEWVSAKTREELIGKMKEKLSVLLAASFEFTQPIQLRFNELMTGTKSDIAVKIYGDNLSELSLKAKEAEGIIKNIHGAADIRVEQTDGLPQLIIHFKRDNIARHGLTIEQLNNTIRTAFAGTNVGFVYENDRKFELVIRMASDYRRELNLYDLNVRTPDNNVIPLSEVAEVEFIEGPMQISRDNTRRRINIGINVRDRDIQSLVAEIDSELKENLILKPGYYLQYGGQFENLEKARQRLSIAVPIALLLILILLFFTFSSSRYAILIFTAVPLSAVGGIAALWIRGMPFSISAGVGFIALFGVAVLNGIVLISYYRQMQQEGITNVNYIVIKGACTRLRPVLITATTDILGFLPMAISTSAGAEIQRPLATVVIGGIITSTMLTLIILPILYLLMNSKDGLNFRPKRKKKKLLSLTIIPLLIISMKAGAQDSSYVQLSMKQAVEQALSNNLQLKNIQLEYEKNKIAKKTPWNFDPTSINYQQGQLNSTEQDYYFEINQNFGSILSHIQASRLANSQLAVSSDNYELRSSKLKAETKSAYLFWQYLHAINLLKEEETELYSQLAHIANLKYKLGDINQLEHIMALSKVSEKQGQLLDVQDKILISENMLNELIMSDQHYIPEQGELKLYKVQRSSDTITYSGEKLISLHKNTYELSRLEESYARSEYFPEINAGYFSQKIGNIKSLDGWQIGIEVPLLFINQQADIKQAKISSEIALNNLKYQQQKVHIEIENLLFELNRHFRQVRHYQNLALPKAEVLLATAFKQLETEEIDYPIFLQSISQAFEIKEKYLGIINKYNQTAIQLEIYGE